MTYSNNVRSAFEEKRLVKVTNDPTKRPGLAIHVYVPYYLVGLILCLISRLFVAVEPSCYIIMIGASYARQHKLREVRSSMCEKG
jgi:hypothetical protein